METPKIFESEYHFCEILWDHEPVSSGELVRLCSEKLQWKKSTTYTVIRRLSQRGVLKCCCYITRIERRGAVERKCRGSGTHLFWITAGIYCCFCQEKIADAG